MSFRGRFQQGAQTATAKAHDIRKTIRDRDDMPAHALDSLESVSRSLVDQLKKGTFWVVSKSAERLGADRYREELDAALQEALRVISVQEERIAVLEEKLAGRA